VSWIRFSNPRSRWDAAIDALSPADLMALLWLLETTQSVECSDLSEALYESKLVECVGGYGHAGPYTLPQINPKARRYVERRLRP
jgi:hypothetical protein